MEGTIAVKGEDRIDRSQTRYGLTRHSLAELRMIRSEGQRPCTLDFSASFKGSLSLVSALSARELARRWTGRLAHYQSHQNVEHLEALLAEALRFTGLHLENELAHSNHWSSASLARRASLLLFLVDRGVIFRTTRAGRVTFEAGPDAMAWILAQPSMVPYLVPTLEFLAALQAYQSQRPRSTQA